MLMNETHHEDVMLYPEEQSGEDMTEGGLENAAYRIAWTRGIINGTGHVISQRSTEPMCHTLTYEIIGM